MEVPICMHEEATSDKSGSHKCNPQLAALEHQALEHQFERTLREADPQDRAFILDHLEAVAAYFAVQTES